MASTNSRSLFAVCAMCGTIFASQLPPAAAAPAPLPSLCGQLMTGVTEQLLNLCAYGIDSGLLKPEQIRNAFSEKIFLNPVTTTKNYENNALKDGFDEALLLVRESDRNQIRAAINGYLASLTRKEELAGDARDKTKYYAAPELISSQDIKDENVRSAKVFWQKTAEGDVRALAITLNYIHVWYPDNPGKSFRQAHHIPTLVVDAGIQNGPWPWLSALTSKNDDALIAYRKLVHNPDPPPNAGLFKSLAYRWGFTGPKWIQNQIGLYSLNERREVALAETGSAVRKLALTELSNGEIWLVAIMDTAIEVFRKDGEDFTRTNTIPLNPDNKTEIYRLMANGELLVVAFGHPPGNDGKTLIHAYNPIRSGQPVAEWKVYRSVEWVSPYVTRAGEVVAAVKLQAIFGEIKAHMVYLRQSSQEQVRPAGAGRDTRATFWHEDKEGRLLAFSGETNGASTDIAILEPFDNSGRGRELNRITAIATTSIYNYQERRDLPPPPRVIQTADGSERLLLHTDKGLVAYSLETVSQQGSVPSDPTLNFAVSLLPESGAHMVVANSSHFDSETVVFQELNTPRPTMTYGNQRALQFLPAIEGKDGRPWMGFAVASKDNKPAQMVFFALTSSTEAKPSGAN